MKYILALILLCLFKPTSASSIPIEAFAKPLEYYNAVISPDGKHIAIQRSADEGKTLVAIVKTDNLSLASYIGATSDVSPFQPIWVNNNRIVVRFTEEYTSYEQEFANGELQAINTDGKKSRKIIEHQRFVTLAGDPKPLNNLHGFAKVIHSLPSKEKSVLIHFEAFNDARFEVDSELIELNTVTGKYRRITKAPSYDAYFVLSKEGKPLYSVGRDKGIKDKNVNVVHKFHNGNWNKLTTIDLGAETFQVIAPTENPEEIIINAEFLTKTDRVYRYNIVTGEKKSLFAHANVDPSAFDIDAYTKQLIAVHFDDGMPNLHLIDNHHLYARWYPALYREFPNQKVRITSATRDGKQFIFKVSGANEPGQFHLFNVKTKKFRYLFNAAKWINAKELSETTPLSMTARDGLTLHGYLTKPREKQAAYPLVVLPHGGPHGIRDFWRYDQEVQFLASQGYAVLQVNFRSSGGYGRSFHNAGYRKWGSDVQHDIIDATKWAAEREDIDSKRICIMGASFGGYSALMSSILEPKLFKCAIGALGIYDLNLTWKSGDIKTHRMGRNYLNKAIGSDKTTLTKFSPAHRLEELETPVLIIHGKKDHRASIKHYNALKEGLELKNHPYETLLFKKESHGFANEKNRLAYFKRVKLFLDKHIGKE